MSPPAKPGAYLTELTDNRCEGFSHSWVPRTIHNTSLVVDYGTDLFRCLRDVDIGTRDPDGSGDTRDGRIDRITTSLE